MVPTTSSRVHRAWSRVVCHPAERVSDREIGGVRKITSGTGDVNPTTAVSIARAEREVPLQRHLTRGGCGAYRVIGVAFSVLPVPRVPRLSLELSARNGRRHAACPVHPRPQRSSRVFGFFSPCPGITRRVGEASFEIRVGSYGPSRRGGLDNQLLAGLRAPGSWPSRRAAVSRAWSRVQARPVLWASAWSVSESASSLTQEERSSYGAMTIDRRSRRLSADARNSAAE